MADCKDSCKTVFGLGPDIDTPSHKMQFYVCVMTFQLQKYILLSKFCSRDVSSRGGLRGQMSNSTNIAESDEGTMHDVRSIATILKANVRASRAQTPQNTRDKNTSIAKTAQIKHLISGRWHWPLYKSVPAKSIF